MQLRNTSKLHSDWLISDMKSVVSSSFFEPICIVLNDIFTEANDDCILLIVKFIQCFVLCARNRFQANFYYVIGVIQLRNTFMTSYDYVTL